MASASDTVIEDIYPLSPIQKGLLFHSRLTPESDAYFRQSVYEIEGALNVAVFEGAWKQTIRRHALLRTAFFWEEVDTPVQIVCSDGMLPLVLEDLRNMKEPKRDAAVQQYIANDRKKGFNLGEAPLLRLGLLRVEEEHYYFVFSFHHLLLDGWSYVLVLKEVKAYYDAYLAGMELKLPEPRPYREYVNWLEKQDLCEAEAWWRGRLRGFTTPTPLPLARSIGAVVPEAMEHQREELRLSWEESEALQRLARQQQVTLNTLVQGAWGLLLSRYSGERDVVFGVTVSGRNPRLEGVESMVGLFINTLPVRMKFHAGESASAWLKRVQREQAEASGYDYTPLVQVQSWSEVERGMPLFESLYVFENFSTDSFEKRYGENLENTRKHEVSFRVRPDRSFDAVNYPLALLVVPTERLSLRIMFHPGRFREGAAEQMLAKLRMILLSMTADTKQSVNAVRWMSEAERCQVLEKWNRTEEETPALCVHELFEEQVAETPEAVAVEEERQQLTYTELNQHANQLAHYLQKLGVGPEAYVGVYLDRTENLVVGFLAVLKAGGVYVPLDPNYPLDRLNFMIRETGLQVLLTTSRLAHSLPDFQIPMIKLDQDWEIISEEASSNPPVNITPKNLAYVIYTSGSTGTPKGVQIEHRGMLNHLAAKISDLQLTALDVVAETASSSFDISVWQMLAVLLTGGRVRIIGDDIVRDAFQLLNEMRRTGVTVLETVPALLQEMVERDDGIPPELPKLRWMISNAEALPISLCEIWKRKYPGIPLLNAYGPTECSDDISHYLVSGLEEGLAYAPLGWPLMNTKMYVVDEEMEPVPVGVPGELYIGGTGVGRGYLKRGGLTAERFVPNPFTTVIGERLYRTGDVVRQRPDGTLDFIGRRDYQVKIRGFRVELGEIESALLVNPSVKQTVVIAREDQPGEKRLVAYLVLQPGKETLEADLLRASLQDQLPDYMVPAAFVVLTDFPLTPNGKIDRKALPAPEYGAKAETEETILTPVQEIVAGIWKEVLHLEHAGLHDNFFDLGGHSLLAMQVVSRTRTAFGVELPLRVLFETDTLAEFATQVELAIHKEEKAEIPAIVPLPREGTLSLSFAQQRLWFLEQMEPGNAVYNVPVALRISGELDRGALSRSIRRIVERHEVLRTVFVSNREQEPVQRVVSVEEAGVVVEEMELGELGAERREAEARRLAGVEAGEGFNLSTGPLLRVKLLRLGAKDHVLLVTMHHIVSDGWSIGILVREFSALYEGYVTGREAELAELGVQYADYAVWQREWLGGGELQGQMGYWKKQLAGLERLELPTDRVRPGVMSHRGATVEMELGEELRGGIRGLCRGEGVTLFMALLGGVQVLLGRYAGQQEVAVGTPIANRTRREIEPLIGFFVNTLVVRGEVRREWSIREMLKRVREVTLGAYAHQEVPFEQLVEEMQPVRDLSRSPLFEVMLSVQNTPQESFSLPGLSVEVLGREGGEVAKFDLTFSAVESGGKIRIGINYATELYEHVTIARMARHFHRILEQVADDAGKNIGEIQLLDFAERTQMISEWNCVPQPIGHGKVVHELFEEQAERNPQAVALVYEHRRMDYEELNRRANQLAHYLRRLGVGPEVRVALCMERSPEMVIGILGVLKAGGAYVPLDPSHPQERLVYILQDANAQVLISTAEYGVPSFAGPIVRLDPDWEQLASESAVNPAKHVFAENLAYVIYTSGSTGNPKGSLNTHHNLSWLVAMSALQFNFSQQDVWTLFHSYAFDFSVWEMWGALAYGGRLVVVPFYVSRSPQEFHELLLREKVTVLNQTPSAFQQFLQDGSWRKEGSCLRYVIFGGEMLEVKKLQAWFDYTTNSAVQMVNMYGITETTVHVTWREIGLQDLNHGRSPIGVPLPGLQCYVLDERMQLLPVGVPGELYVGGEGLSRGYLNRSDLAAVRFVPNPLSGRAGDRLYRTGDNARWLAHGELEYLGRLDQQVKIRGYRIELGEIEARLGEHAGVREAVVVAREDTPGDKRLVAYVVPDEAHAYPMLQLLRLEQSGELPLATRYELPNGMVVSHQNKSETDFVYREIFEQETYLRHGITLSPNACVFDVGANVGLFTLAVLQRAPQARMYAFEPIPPVFESLRINSLLSGGEVHLFNCGLSSAAGNADFTWFRHNSVISGRYADLAEEQETIKAFMKNQAGAEITEEALENLIRERMEHQQFRCSLRTVSEVIAAEKIDRIDLLKIDVEKSEFEVMEGINEGDWPKIAQLVVDVHDIQGRLNRMRQLLEDHGYEVTVEQDELLASTHLYTIFARRPENAEQNGASSQPFSSRPVPVYWSAEQLTTVLRQYLSGKLPEYMIPAAFVMLEKFPLNANGKLDRKALPVPEREGRKRKYEEPVGETEKALGEIFQEVLRIEKVGRHDNFFELGGHSLLAARLRAAVRNRLNHDLSLMDVFQNPTIAKMAKRTELPAQGLRPQILVPLQPLGLQAPFFCVHPVGGQVLTYSVLARELGRGRPFYGLQSPTSDSPYGPLDTVEQMASAYIQEIRQVQPHGPYILGGWSMGGLVAFEMARQLRAAAESIALLALFDTYPPTRNRAIDGGDNPSVTLARFALEMARMMGRDINPLQSKFDQSSLEEQKKLVIEELLRGEMVSRDNAEAEFNHLLNVYTCNLQAMTRYSPPPQDQSILLFKAVESEDSQVVGEQWKALSIREVEFHMVPGNHYTVLQQPAVANVASFLKIRIEAAFSAHWEF